QESSDHYDLIKNDIKEDHIKKSDIQEEDLKSYENFTYNLMKNEEKQDNLIKEDIIVNSSNNDNIIIYNSYEENIIPDFTYEENILQDFPYEDNIIQDFTYEENILQDFPYEENIIQDFPYEDNIIINNSRDDYLIEEGINENSFVTVDLNNSMINETNDVDNEKDKVILQYIINIVILNHPIFFFFEHTLLIFIKGKKNIPTLIFCGEKDDLYDDDVYKNLNTYFTNSHIIVFKGENHYIIPSRTSDIILCIAIFTTFPNDVNLKSDDIYFPVDKNGCTT
ncbi:hypothetical protein PFMG_04422, partial [Plasmodium falciparum IGH-CR14]